MSDDPRPPTLYELIGFFTAATLELGPQKAASDDLYFSLLVSREKLAEAGISFVAYPSQVFVTLLAHLQRLDEIDSVTETYRDTDKRGATVGDCIAFLNNELKNVPPTSELASRLRRNFYNTTLHKLVELQTWRAAVDSERFQNQREAERKRQTEQSRRDEEIRRQQAEEAVRRRNESFEGLFRDAADFNRFSWEKYREEFRQKRETPKGRSWWEILGVSSSADKATIKSAWRGLAKQLHPDRQGGDTVRMAEINAAKDRGLAGIR